MIPKNTPVENLSENEAIVYDRQIRLWGLDGQKRLRKTKLLVVGCQGLAGETVKNIVLAGIETLVLCDSENATKFDVKSNFLIPISCIGKNRAESCVERTKTLNPTVKVSSDTRSVDQIDENFLKNFTAVLVTNCNISDIVRLNEICRKHNIKFYSGHIWGSIGYYFVDLNKHYYIKEVKKLITKKELKDKKGSVQQDVVDISDDEDDKKMTSPKPSTSKTIIYNNEDDDLMIVDENEEIKSEEKDTENNTNEINEPESIFLEKEECYPAFKDTYLADFINDPYLSRLIRRKRFDPTYFAVLALLRFRTIYERNPSDSTPEEDFSILLQIVEEILDFHKINKDYVSKSLLINIFNDIPAVCAVIGGVLAQEIIIAVSGTDKPMRNYFLFNPVSTSGTTHYLGPPNTK